MEELIKIKTELIKTFPVHRFVIFINICLFVFMQRSQDNKYIIL